MATNESQSESDDAQVFEIEVEQRTAETVTVRAESRSEAFEALKEPQGRDVQEVLVRKDFSSLSERRPVDGRHAPELEDYGDEEIDLNLTDN